MSKAKHLLLHLRLSKTLLPCSSSSYAAASAAASAAFLRHFSSTSSSDDDGGLAFLRDRVAVLFDKPPAADDAEDSKEDLRPAVSALADELLSSSDYLPEDDLASVLDAHSFTSILRRSPDGFASVHLLSRLKSRPLLALQIFDWRRKMADVDTPLLPHEYSKAITLAGRAKNVDLAADLFADTLSAGICEACHYNALMAAYMYNGLTKKAEAIFQELKHNPKCKPTIVSYNILLSVYSRSMLMDQMEAVLRAIDESALDLTITTYNTTIAGYVTAWMWDRMEETFKRMEDGPINPDTDTLLLMLRGYAYSGNLERMESIYEQVKELVNSRKVHLLRVMICAYSKSSGLKRVQKIEALLKYIPDDDYRPWLNVLLIRVYAQEGLLEAMERLISEAFQRHTIVTTVGVMRSIISSYFRCNAVDQLALFIKQAESAGWRLCRSLYHCKMVMYGQQSRLEEMHGVLNEMETSRFYRTKKTFLILFKAYNSIGRRSEAETVMAMMWKHGFGKPEDVFIF